MKPQKEQLPFIFPLVPHQSSDQVKLLSDSRQLTQVIFNQQGEEASLALCKGKTTSAYQHL